MQILESILKAIVQHAKGELPCEACGYLAGKDGVVAGHYPLTNIDQAVDHFAMAPQEQFAALKAMRSGGMTLMAVYHSHPASPARPSVEDIRLAFDPEVSYVIISLATEETVVKAFRIRQGEVTPEEITILAEPGQAATTLEVATMGNAFPFADRVKNCRGVGCPMNLVYAKVELAKLATGQILEIILDDGAPVNNVPGSVLKEGHKILAQTQLEDGAWSVLIKKAPRP